MGITGVQQNLALLDIGRVPRGLGFKGCPRSLIFMYFWIVFYKQK